MQKELFINDYILCDELGPNNTPGLNETVVLNIRYTSIVTGLINTPFTLTFAGIVKSLTFYDSSVTLITGDLLHLYITSSNSHAYDLSEQIDLY